MSLSAVEETLQFVAGTGEIVTVVYNGGSHPGQSRQIIPIAIKADELIVTEPGIEFHNHYKLIKIASVELSSGRRVISNVASRARSRRPLRLLSFGRFMSCRASLSAI